MNNYKEAAVSYWKKAAPSADCEDGFLEGVKYCLNIIEGQILGYEQNGSEETKIALSNLLYFIKGKE